jgi:hypothetical protein
MTGGMKSVKVSENQQGDQQSLLLAVRKSLSLALSNSGSIFVFSVLFLTVQVILWLGIHSGIFTLVSMFEGILKLMYLWITPSFMVFFGSFGMLVVANFLIQKRLGITSSVWSSVRRVSRSLGLIAVLALLAGSARWGAAVLPLESMELEFLGTAVWWVQSGIAKILMFVALVGVVTQSGIKAAFQKTVETLSGNLIPFLAVILILLLGSTALGAFGDFLKNAAQTVLGSDRPVVMQLAKLPLSILREFLSYIWGASILAALHARFLTVTVDCEAEQKIFE